MSGDDVPRCPGCDSSICPDCRDGWRSNNINIAGGPVTPGSPSSALLHGHADQQSASVDQRTTERHRCGRCDARWRDIRVAHCGGCHQTFSSSAVFDRHRTMASEHGHCADPATVTGLEFRDGMWRGPAMDADALAARTGAR